MKTSTVILPPDLPEVELATLLERRFGASWFPDLHRWSVESADATLFLDYGPDYGAQGSAAESGQPNFPADTPTGPALHVYASKYHPDSARLADEVSEAVRNLVCERSGSSRPTARLTPSSLTPHLA